MTITWIFHWSATDLDQTSPGLLEPRWQTQLFLNYLHDIIGLPGANIIGACWPSMPRFKVKVLLNSVDAIEANRVN